MKKENNVLPTHEQRARQTLYTPRKPMHCIDYDYQTAGAYAVTICAHNRRERPFHMSGVEHLLKEEWENLSQHFANITSKFIVVMPDHLHAIIWHHGRGENTKSIIDVINGYKSFCTIAWLRHLKARKVAYPGELWQRDFYDHIIRNEKDLENQITYMLNNPVKARIKQGRMAIEKACTYNSCGHIPFPPE